MDTKRKCIAALFLSASICISLFGGCGSQSASDAGQAPESPTEQSSALSASEAPADSETGERITVKLWLRASSTEGPYDTFADNFNASQDKIQVQLEGYGENYFNVLNIALNSDSPPDIFEIQSSPPIPTFAEAGQITPIDDLVTEEFKADFYESTFAKRDLYYNGNLYAIPIRIQHYKLIYNKDLFEKSGLDPNRPPETLEEMAEYAQTITDAGAGNFYGMAVYITASSYWMRSIDLIAIAQGEFGPYGFDYKTGRFDFSNQKKYFEYWLKFVQDGTAFPGATSIDIEQMRANFAQGNVGMMIDGNWITNVFAHLDTDQNWDATPIPVFAGSPRAKDYANCDVTFAIASEGKNIPEAKEVYKALIESQIDFRSFGDADARTYTPANTKEAYDLLPTDLNFQGLEQMVDVSNNATFALEPHRFITLEGDSRDTVLNNQLALALDGKADIDAALADLTVRYNEALDKAIAEGILKEEELKPENFDYFNR